MFNLIHMNSVIVMSPGICTSPIPGSMCLMAFLTYGKNLDSKVTRNLNCDKIYPSYIPLQIDILYVLSPLQEVHSDGTESRPIRHLPARALHLFRMGLWGTPCVRFSLILSFISAVLLRILQKHKPENAENNNKIRGRDTLMDASLAFNSMDILQVVVARSGNES